MKSVTSLRKSQEWRDNQQDARCNDEIQRNTFQVMQPRHPIDEISRNQATNHAKNRTADRSKAQNGSIENNGAPRHENRKDQDAQRNGTDINLIFRHDTFQTVHGNATASFTEAQKDAEESRNDSKNI